MRVLITGFGAGEFSPLLEGRTDLAAAASGCRRLRNAIPRAIGGAFQRPGFILAGMTQDQAYPTRLLPFAFSNAITYRIEIGQYFARFWIGNVLCIHQAGLTGPQYLSVPGEPLRLATPWSAVEAFRVQLAQANDVIWLTHDDHLQRRLIRYGLEDWRIEEMPMEVPPMRDPNALDAVTLAASAVSGGITLTAAGGNVFNPLDVGGYYEVAHRRDLPFADLSLMANANTAGLRITGKWEVFSYGKWTGTLYLERQMTTGAWEVIRSWKSIKDFNAQATGEVDGDVVMRLRYVGTGTTVDTVDPRAQLGAIDATVRGLVKVTGYTSPTVVTGTVVRPIHATTATVVWAEGAWSPRRGYPRAVTLHGQRIIFAGNRSQPQTIWGSAVNAFNNFERTTLEDAGFAYQIAAQQSNAIVWLTSQKGLLIGTEGDEWILDGGDNGAALTAATARAERRSGFGSENIQAALIGSAVVFVQTGATILNEYVFDFAQQGYEAVELTELSEHFGDERFVQFAFAQNPHSVLWAVTEAGSLLSLTYKRRNQTLAWAKHTTPLGLFESVCCTPGPNGVHEVWVTVKRTIGGFNYRTVERMDPGYWAKVKAGETRQLCVGDGAVVRGMAATTLITGLGHLEGAEVAVLADGAVHAPRRVLGGQITLSSAATAVVVGLPPLVEIQPMPVEIQMDTGSSFGRRFRVPDIDVKLWQTGGAPTYADERDGKSFDIALRTGYDAPDAPVPLFTGTKKIPFPARHQQATSIILRNETLLPLNILSLVMQVDINGE